MTEGQILSSFQHSTLDSTNTAVGALPPGAAPDPLVFDACQVGVVLRAVLFVELVVAIAGLFISDTPLAWGSNTATLTGGALAATLAWLIAACSLKRVLARLPPLGQYLAGAGLGALAASYGVAMLSLAGLFSLPWLGSACAGALLASLLVHALVLRARARTPASTVARLAELQARIRPHFLFNTLNSAIALVRAEPERAERLLEDLSELFRHALADAGESVSLAEEIAMARNYLAIEQVRFGERLQLEWALDPQADAARLPPLLLQPLVENAVRHGVEPSPGGARIRIQTERRGERIVLHITNTLPGGPGQPGQGLALDNVRRRLALLHDVHADFRAGEKDGVFRVRLEFAAGATL